MRELVFEIEYDPGENRVGDTLAKYPDAEIRSLSLHATTESLWRVDHVTSPAEALEDIEPALLDTHYATDCLTPAVTGATQQTEVLETSDEKLLLYSYLGRTDSCPAGPQMALERLGQGVLFEATKQARRHLWRLTSSTPQKTWNPAIGSPPGVTFEVPTRTQRDPASHRGLSPFLPRIKLWPGQRGPHRNPAIAA